MIAPSTSIPTRPTQYDRFRNHMGAAFAQLGEARSESRISQYTEPEDVTDALRTARVASDKIHKALDLGYLNSDDSGSYAWDAGQLTRAGIDALAPFKDARFAAPNFPHGFETAMSTAQQAFSQAQEMVVEALGSMHD